MVRLPIVPIRKGPLYPKMASLLRQRPYVLGLQDVSPIFAFGKRYSGSGYIFRST
jgi:hypothetical protein